MWSSLYFLVVFYAPLIAKLEFPSLLFFFFSPSVCLWQVQAPLTLNLLTKQKQLWHHFLWVTIISGIDREMWVTSRGGLRLCPQARWKMENLYTFNYFWITWHMLMKQTEGCSLWMSRREYRELQNSFQSQPHVEPWLGQMAAGWF